MRKLEAKYRDVLVVIGVQSPKYPAEAVPQNLRLAAERLEVDHPVVDDAEYVVWDAYAVRAWPTLMFLAPDGTVIGTHAGEAPFEALDSVLEQMVAEYERAGMLTRAPLSLGVEEPIIPTRQLAFPGKVLASDVGLFIADSGHNRIVHADFTGNVLATYGGPEAEFADGPGVDARFHRPQGMAHDVARNALYVADAGNNAIRLVDLESGTVSTIAGTGKLGTSAVRRGDALTTALRSPWDVDLAGDELLIAMAGSHQIWSLDFRTSEVAVWAGTGHEDIRDGPRQSAWFAQPMGLAMDDGALLVSCAESQAVRRIDFGSGQVTTVVGRGLFEFGDIDGPTDVARLQHNQSVAVTAHGILIADTYNNKIKRIERDGVVTSWLGSGTSGHLDGPGPDARFDEPDGLSERGGVLYIADTNNHAIRTVDIESATVQTLDIRGLS